MVDGGRVVDEHGGWWLNMVDGGIMVDGTWLRTWLVAAAAGWGRRIDHRNAGAIRQGHRAAMLYSQYRKQVGVERFSGATRVERFPKA